MHNHRGRGVRVAGKKTTTPPKKRLPKTHAPKKGDVVAKGGGYMLYVKQCTRTARCATVWLRDGVAEKKKLH